MVQTCFGAKVPATSKGNSSATLIAARQTCFSRRAAGAEARVEIALSHKHPPEEPMEAAHQKGCLSHMGAGVVLHY